MHPPTALPLTVTLAVLAAAVIHATWNAVAHGIKDQLVAFALIGAGGILVAIPLVLVAPLPRSACWPYLLGSVVIHVFYTLLLMRSFRFGEFSQVYPLARGMSPLVVTILAAAFAAERPALPQLAGVLIVSAGLGLLVFAGRRPGRPALIAAIGTGLTIAAYTTVDGLGVRLSASPAGYIGWLMLLESLCVPMFALVRRRHVLRAQPWRVLAAGLAAGALSVLAYGLVLWAQTRGALAPIAALRETSVIFGAIIGTMVFREPFGRTRIAATILVVTGILLLNTALRALAPGHPARLRLLKGGRPGSSRSARLTQTPHRVRECGAWPAITGSLAHSPGRPRPRGRQPPYRGHQLKHHPRLHHEVSARAPN